MKVILFLFAISFAATGCGSGSSHDIPPAEDPAIMDAGPSPDGVAIQPDPALGG